MGQRRPPCLHVRAGDAATCHILEQGSDGVSTNLYRRDLPGLFRKSLPPVWLWPFATPIDVTNARETEFHTCLGHFTELVHYIESHLLRC